MRDGREIAEFSRTEEKITFSRSHCCYGSLSDRSKMSDALKDIIISDTFAVQSERVRVTLKKECLSWELENTPKSKKVIPLRHLVAVTPCDCSSYKQTKLLQCNYCRVHFHYKSSFNKLLLVNVRSIKVHYVVPSGKHRWKLQSKVLQPLKTAKVKEWLDTVQGTLSELNRPKHLLVFINPYGGKKRAVEIYEKKVLPIFHLAGIETHAVVTQRANHAKELISDIDIWKYDGIICVGGDGMFSEILNSVLLRTQKEKNIDVNDVYNTLVVPRIPLGIIPAGSTNAAVNCITGSSDPISSTLIIVMGTYTGIDLCGIYSKNYFLRFAITFLSYGYFGDVINESEKFRWMGPKRYDYAGIKGILKRKIYEGEIQLRIDSSVNQSSLKKERCNVGCETCHKAPHLSKYEKRSKIRWLSLTGRFIAVNAAVMNCSCDMCPKGISPSQHIGNGYCDVILIHSCSRLNYLRYLLRTTYHHSDPFDLDFVQVYRVREFRFKPFITNESNCAGTQESSQERNTSVWNCDGEIITDAGLSAKMHCQLVNVFGRGFESRIKPSIWSQCYKFLKRA